MTSNPMPLHPITLSFVSPVYGCPDALEELCQRIDTVCERLACSYEIILVDDVCPRNSWHHITQIAKRNPAVKGYRLSRNFGQHAAIQAGLAQSQGEWVIVMDCDLQDQPECVADLYQKALEGYDIVRARRSNRCDSWFRRTVSQFYYTLLGYLTDTHQDAAIANFGIYHRKVINAVLSWQEQNKLFPVIVQWVGFNHTAINVEHAERFSGKSSYTLKKLISLALRSIVSFSDKPLRLMIYFGATISMLTFIISFYLLVSALLGTYNVTGWASLIISIWFLSGIIISVIGITGIYVGRTLSEVKKRPDFIISHTTADTDAIS